jgi:molybdopterin-synthase adenylyltransferase
MTLDSTSQKMRALTIQLIEIDNGILLKRGCTEVKIGGEGAAEAVQVVLSAAAGPGATREEICERFATPSRPAVERLIDLLIARHMLVPSNGVESVATDRESSLDILYWHFGVSAAEVTQRLNSRQIVIVGVNCISRQLVASLSASDLDNFRVIDYPLLRNLRLFDDTARLLADQWPASAKPPLAYEEWADKIDPQSLDCLVATSDFGGQQEMRPWNKFCVEHDRHFLPVVLQNVIGYVGPLVIPGETACFECLRARQNAHLEDPQTRRAAEDVAFEGQVVTGFHPAMASVLGDLAAIELTKFYSGVLPLRNVGTLIEVNLLATQLTARKVLKIPRCAVCSPLHTRSSTTAQKTVFAPAGRIRK